MGFLMRRGGQEKRRGKKGCKSGLWREMGGFMRVCRPSLLLIRKDSNSLQDKGTREGEREREVRGRR